MEILGETILYGSIIGSLLVIIAGLAILVVFLYFRCVEFEAIAERRLRHINRMYDAEEKQKKTPFYIQA